MFLVITNDSYRELDVTPFALRELAEEHLSGEIAHAERKANDGGNEIRVSFFEMTPEGLVEISSKDYGSDDDDEDDDY